MITERLKQRGKTEKFLASDEFGKRRNMHFRDNLKNQARLSMKG